MDRVNSRVAQVYGYAVCFITVVVMLIAIKQVVDAAFDLSDPIRADNSGFGRMGRQLASFELYKADAKRQSGTRSDGGPMPVGVTPSRTATDTLSDGELQRLYDAEREAAVGNARFRAARSFVSNLLLMILAGVLFGVHWRWLKRRDALPAAA